MARSWPERVTRSFPAPGSTWSRAGLHLGSLLRASPRGPGRKGCVREAALPEPHGCALPLGRASARAPPSPVVRVSPCGLNPLFLVQLCGSSLGSPWLARAVVWGLPGQGSPQQ